jgi:hypothetical protein
VNTTRTKSPDFPRIQVEPSGFVLLEVAEMPGWRTAQLALISNGNLVLPE